MNVGYIYVLYMHNACGIYRNIYIYACGNIYGVYMKACSHIWQYIYVFKRQSVFEDIYVKKNSVQRYILFGKLFAAAIYIFKP